jgi:hypothetical protein
VQGNRQSEIFRQLLRVPFDRSAAGHAHRVRGGEYFLQRRAGETGERLEGALGDRGAKVDVAEDPIEWIDVLVIVGLGK